MGVTRAISPHSPPPTSPCSLDIADPATAPAGRPYAAPPPETVLVLQHYADSNDGPQVDASVRDAEHTAEVTRLTQALHAAKQAHAIEIERLRAQHAASVQRLVEALWRAQDAAKTAATSAQNKGEMPAFAAEPPPEPKHMPSGASLARFMGRVGLPSPAWACRLQVWIARRCALVFRAWR